MKRYVVVYSWANIDCGEQGVSIELDTSNLERAREEVRKYRDKWLNTLIDEGLTVYTDTVDCLDVGEDGFYTDNFAKIDIHEVDVDD